MRRQLGIGLVAAALLGAAQHALGAQFVPGDEARVTSMVNTTRAEHGLPALTSVDRLVRVARDQSARMVAEQRLFHNPHLGVDLTAIGLDWHWSGENVGVGPDVEAIEQAFLASSHHLENILRVNYDSIGVGVAADPDGYIYVTQVFADLSGARASLPSATTPPPAPPRPSRPPARTPARATPKPTTKPPDPIVIEGGVVWDGPPASATPDPARVDALVGLLGRLARIG